MTEFTILTRENAITLWNHELANLRPLQTEKDLIITFDEFVNTVTGKTVREFNEWNYPENPSEDYARTMYALGETDE